MFHIEGFKFNVGSLKIRGKNSSGGKQQINGHEFFSSFGTVYLFDYKTFGRRSIYCNFNNLLIP